MNCAAADFSRLLKQWRRTRRVSQLGLALVAGVSAKHIAFIERGRSRPSREMVLILAEALDVPLGERNVLLRAAGFADVFLKSSLESAALEPVRRALRFVLSRHEPYPAMVIDTEWNLHLANDAARDLLETFSSKPPPARPNVLRLLLDPRWLQPFIENWPDLRNSLVWRLEREAVGAAGGAPLRRLLEDVRSSERDSTQPAKPETEAPTLPFVPLVLGRSGLRLSMFSLLSTFPTAVDVGLHDLRVETLLPADDSTLDHLQRRATERRRGTHGGRARRASAR